MPVLRPLTAHLVLAGVLATACNNTPTPIPTPAPVQIRLATDAATLPLMRALTDGYSAAHPNVSFALEWGNAPAAYEAMRAGRVQLTVVSVMPSTLVQGGPNARQPWFTDLALDSLVVIANPQNKLSNLSTFDLREIYAGSRSRWSDIDPALSGDIDLGSREANDPTRNLFEGAVMNKLAPSPNAIVLPSIEVMLNFVALQPGAIGYVPASRASKEQRVKMISIDNTLPNRATLSNSSYHLSIPVYLMANNEPDGEARQFVAWMLGPNGQQIATKQGYISLN